jgi:hypothetical protein
MRLVHSLEAKTWRDFVDGQPMGNVFHTPEMYQVYSKTKDREPELWGVMGSNNVPLALFTPVRVTLPNPLLRRLAVHSVSYGSLLWAPGEPGEKALEMLIQAYKRERKSDVAYTELRHLADVRGILPLLDKQGFKFEGHLDYQINLGRSVEEVFQDIGPRTRKNIRRGLNKGHVSIQEVREKKQVATCYEILSRTYGAAHIPLADISLFEAAYDLLVAKGMVRFLLAYVNQTPVATSIELIHKGTIYGWYGGVDRRHNSYSPNELLSWHILKWGVENGYKLYDFGGAGKPGERYGVRDFKAKFGGSLTCFGRSTYAHKPLIFRVMQMGRRFSRRFL